MVGDEAVDIGVVVRAATMGRCTRRRDRIDPGVARAFR